jgi:D-galactonate transporter
MAATTTPAIVQDATPASDRLYRKVGWRLMPLLFICYFAAYLDRVNIGFAKLQMQSALAFSDSVYGLGAGVFFIGYFLLEVPSNIALHKLGARKWIARIMITWGALSVAMMFTRSPLSFYTLRFFLGCAEAGFFPGIILYMTYWFPDARRARATSIFISAIPFSGIIGGPLSGAILHGMDGVHGWAGWQWLFLLEGLPAILLGFVLLVYLDDRVEMARWLTPSEREHLARDIAAEHAGHPPHAGTFSVLRKGWIWMFALADFCFVCGLYGISFWLPSLIKALGITDPLNVGLASSVPWIFGVIAMYFGARSADRIGERRWHVIITGLLGATGLVLSAAFHAQPMVSLFGLTLGTMGIMANVALFWSIPPSLLTGAGAAVGIALINSFGNLSGFAAPYMIGVVKDVTHSTDAGIYALAGLLVAGSIIVLTLKVLKVRPPATFASAQPSAGHP